MKILLLIRQLNVGGAEQQLINLATGLNDRGIEVRVAVFYGGGELEPVLVKRGITIVQLEKKGRWDILSFGVRFLTAINNFKPEIVYGFLTGPNLCATLSRAATRHTKIFWGLRTSSSDDLIRDKDRFVSISFRFSIWLSYIPNTIILNSYSSQAFFTKKGLDPSKLTVVPNGIDTNRFCYDHYSGKQFRAKYGIPETAMLIGMVARIDPIKDHVTFLAGAYAFALKYPNTYFLLAGTGSPEYINELKSLSTAVGLGRFLLWTGQVGELGGIYNALDVNTLTSKSESLPNVICEAIACGTPCVSTNVGDCAEVIGEFGQIIPTGDSKSLVAAWETILLKDNKSFVALRETAIANISNNYSMSSMLDATINLFNRALEQNAT